MRKWFFLAIGVLVTFSTVAQLFEPIRDRLRKSDASEPGLIQELCLSSVDYSTISSEDLASNDTIFEGENEAQRYEVVSNDFHTRIGCMIDDAMLGTVKETLDYNLQILNDETGRNSISGIDATGILETLKTKESCRGYTILEVANEQAKAREKVEQNLPEGVPLPPRTQCGANGTHPTTANSYYTACRVAEVISAEMCGYGLWLRTNRADEARIIAELRAKAALEGDTRTAFSTSDAFNNALNMINVRNDIEEQNARQAVTEAVEYFAEARQTFRLFMAAKTVGEAMQQSINQIDIFNEQFGTFTTRFDYQMAETCS